jgi:outer membrane protein assembly factor BamD
LAALHTPQLAANFARMKFLLPMLLIFAVGCSSGPVRDTNSAEGAFLSAEDYEKDERFEEAIQKYREVMNKHPYSRFAVESKIRIANIHYERENFVEAQTAYQLVKDLHPRHEKIDFITFRLAMSYFSQLPSTIDRDLSVAQKAILHFDEVMTSYPKSNFVSEAKEKKAEAIKMLAEKESYIAYFYFHRDMYDSALKRYEKILSQFKGTGFELVALRGAALSALKSGDLEKGRVYSKQLSSQYPNSSEDKEVQQELETYGVR